MKICLNKKFRITLVAFIVFLLLCSNNSAQNDTYGNLPGEFSSFKKNQDEASSDVNKNGKNYWLPAVEIFGLNITVWSYSKFISKEGFADISWATMENNLKTGFVWDNDRFLMNQFFHPFHGSNYFNAARSNGLSFWESIPYTISGSLMWEYFMEREPPSFNDLINTSISGITLGEISNRVSNLIIDESTSGFERFLREFSSSLINPMQGFNRMISGKMWRSGNSNERSEFTFVFSTGVHNVFLDRDFDNRKTYATLRGNLIYGNQFDVDAHKKPFDYFSLHAEYSIAEGDDIVGILASGVLFDGKFKLFKSSRNIFGLYKEIDILLNDVYQLTATSVTGQIINTIDFSDKTKMENYLGLSAIIMGGTNSKYSNYEGKDYNFGPGASAKIGIRIIAANSLEIYSNYKRYWLHTVSGAKGEEFVGLLITGISKSVYDKASLGLEFLLYERYGEYEKYPDYISSNTALRLYVKYSI
ncbi:MAG: DUF3943 domain-containing protein [Melioribacteraceae bacterium]|nr:DUF3943 domain-containing protein [Melioribacteraceae bacterium]